METISVSIILGILCVLGGGTAEPHSEGKIRRRRYGGPMGGGGPFHGGGAMGGPMGGMLMGPRAHDMGPSMGGPNKMGQGSNMFSNHGFQCIQKDVVCPKWCLIEDENGCKSCPCGPAGGMSAMSGGPSGGPTGGMSGGLSRGSMGGMSSGPLNTLLSGSFGGNSGVSGSTHNSVSNTLTAGSNGGSSGSTVNNFIGVVGSTASERPKPVHECKATLLCTSTCSRYQLGATTSTGCRSCTCPSSHHVTTTTIHYIVRPTTTECTSTAYCMRTCHSGYTMSTTDKQGCPECTCLQVTEPYKPPVEIAVEPPPYTEQIPTYSVTCRIRPCATGCNVGYKCGANGCPTCDCIHPAVVGLTSIHQVYVERPKACTARLSCVSPCNVGYKCGPDGCPSCECLVSVRPKYTIQTSPQYIVQTCSHTLTCAATCTHGYQVIKDGSGGCGKCVCKQQQVFYETRPVYAVQRLKPKYEIVNCNTASACAARCSYGYELVSNGDSCPSCRCKPAPLYTYTSTGCGSGCTDTGNKVQFITGSNIQGSNYVGNSVLSGGTRIVYKSVEPMGGTYPTGGGAYQTDQMYCPPLPPDCDPSCIRYDTPHCRKCECEASIFNFHKK